MQKLFLQLNNGVEVYFIAIIRKFDWLGPLTLRLYLAPIFLAAGLHKFHNFDDIVNWFGNGDWGLGLPLPWLFAFLATSAEIIGGLALLVGLAVRLMAIPLVITMLVAATTAHWDNGWFAIAPGNPETSMAKVLEPIGFPGSEASLNNSEEVGKRLSAAKRLLRQHGNYAWLTEKGSFVILNNGIEFAATYFIMTLMLLFAGGGRFVSIDYWLKQSLTINAEPKLNRN